MKNLGRAIRRALRQRLTIVGIILSSLVVAVFWGANFGAVYPFVEAVMHRKSLHDWATDRIAESEEAQAELVAAVARLRKEEADTGANRESDIELANVKIEGYEKVIATTRYFQPFIENYLPDGPFETLVLIVALVFAGTIVKNLTLVTNMMLARHFSETTTLQMRNQVFAHTLGMDLGAFNRDRTGDLMNRFTSDVSTISETISFLFGRAIREPLKAIVCLTAALLVSWQLMVFSLIVAPLTMFIAYTLAKSIKRANRRAMEESSHLFRQLLQSLSGIYAVKAYTMEKQETNRFRRTTREVYRKAMKITFYHSLTKFSSEIMGIGVLCISILAGGYLVLNEETHLFGFRMSAKPLTQGSLLAFYAFLIGASDPMRKMSGFLNHIQAGAAAADRIFPLLDRQTTIVEKKNPKTIKSLKDPIVFDDVSFHYEEGEPVLKNVNLTIACDETLAIVGPNGCGKSTLANMIPRFYDPVEGQIRLGYVPLTDARLSDLRRRIGIVTQQTILFDDSVINNIRYGSTRATDEEVVAAAKQAHAHDFIVNKLEKGYDTNVGEAGSRLSGGQRQRICLARAILRNPEVMILDEATSQIDPESEQLIHNALERFAKNRTTIIITHRASTLSLADRILVMEKGRIVDIGTHDELASRCELYQRLYQVSFKQSA